MKRLPQLVACVLLLGIADSVIGPYLVLFGADRAHLSALQVGIFMSAIAVSGIVVTTWLGRRYDRSAGRWPALVAVLSPALGYLALTSTISYAWILLIAVGLLGAGMAAFAQVFTLARTHLDRAGGNAARRGTPVLRSVWSLAWSIGPLIGAAVLARNGYTGLLLATAGLFAVCAVPLVALGRTPSGVRANSVLETEEVARPSRAMWLATVSFTLFHTAMLCGSVALPLFVTRTLDRPDSDVGLLYSVCALVEIPAALALMALPPRLTGRATILVGIALLGVYFVLTVISSGLPALIAAQVARGVAIALVGALGITYLQDLLPGAPGRATSMFGNTFTVGSLVAGIVAGGVAELLGYRAALVVCAGLTVAALVVLSAASDRRATPETARPADRVLPR